MHQLLLLRHAKAVRDKPATPDRDRALNERGRQDTANMRHRLRELGLIPDLVMVSPSRRTIQTLEGLEPWDETPLTEQSEALYLAQCDGILEILCDIPETVRSVMIIGHNPGLHELARRLAGHAAGEPANQLADGFPTCTLAEFEVAGQWRRLPHGARLTRLIGPRHTSG